MKFLSDNEAPMRPEILQAIERTNRDSAASYGEDEITLQLSRQFSDIFEKEVTAYPVLTGTAANALCLSQIIAPYGAVVCEQSAHINVAECGAPEFFTGGKLLGVSGQDGKIAAELLRHCLETAHPHDYHNSKVTGLSLTQATECGTVYRPDEISALTAVACEYGTHTHMDGARFANALAHLGCSPADLTWKSGIDIMSFGSSKNGTMNAEAIVVFNADCSVEIKRRCKRAGQVVSKMRFVSCQLAAYLEDERWLTWARQSNDLARQLASTLDDLDSVEILHPVEANMVIAGMPTNLVTHLRDNGMSFYDWETAEDCYRLVLSNLNSERDIDAVRALL